MKLKITSAVAGIAVAVAYFVLSASPSLGDNVGTINAQVKVGAPCLTLSTTSIDFGSIRFATNPPTVTGSSGPLYTITNCGATNETLFVRGTDAASTSSSTAWSLVAAPCSAGPNTYGLTATEQFAPFAGNLFLTKQDQAFPTPLAGSASQTYNNSIKWPCQGSAGAGETMTMQIIYTVAF